LVHERLYQSKDLARVDFAEYARTLAEGVARALEVPANVALRVEAQELSLSVDLAIPAGLIINELLTNAIKHAFPDGRAGTVRLVLRAHGAQVELIVEDDGVGASAAGTRSGTLGMELVAALTEQLGAELDSSVSASGTRMRIRFALAAPPARPEAAE
jgi:two-component sensor histidine kinase